MQASQVADRNAGFSLLSLATFLLVAINNGVLAAVSPPGDCSNIRSFEPEDQGHLIARVTRGGVPFRWLLWIRVRTYARLRFHSATHSRETFECNDGEWIRLLYLPHNGRDALFVSAKRRTTTTTTTTLSFGAR